MKYLQRLRQSTITNQILSVSSSFMMIGTVALAVFGGFQYCTSRNQLATMQQMIGQNERLIKASSDQATASAKSATVMDSEKQAVLDSADAAKKSATAANTQTDLSKQLVAQNEKAVNAAISQSRSAQASTSIAQQSFSLLERPSLGVESVTEPVFELGKRLRATVSVRNFGHVPAKDATVSSSIIARPSGDINLPCPEPGEVSEKVGLVIKTVFAVNGLKLTTAISRGLVTTDDIKRITVEKSWWIYVYVTSKYGENGKYFFEYYARYNADAKFWEECGNHNRAN